VSIGRSAWVTYWAVGWLAASTGCKSDALPWRNTSASASSASAGAAPALAPKMREEVHGGIRFLVLFSGGADDDSPLVVGMHGRGGSPERFSRIFHDFSGRAKIAFAQGPSKSDQGWAWLPRAESFDDAKFVAAFDAAERQLWQAITDLSHGRRVIVTGFSQGGMLSYVLAARHPREIAYAFPMGGGAPPALFPHDHAPTAPVYALHGMSDDVIDISLARETIAAFREQGAVAELHEFAGVGHDMPPALRDDLLAHIGVAVDAESARAAPTPGAPARGGRTGSAAGVRDADAASKSLR